jgi:Holliday junction DNA helicase RuvB
MTERIISPTHKEEDEKLDQSIRPKQMSDFFGQEKIKKNLEIFIGAAKKRNEPLEHTMLYGPPGLGKTTLAHIIAAEMNAQIRITSGPAIERSGDLAAILTNLANGDILFIDEIHRLNKIVEEILYPAMEDFALDIVVGKGPSARTLRIDLPNFTIIGATTRYNLISSPLRDRFGSTWRLDYYTHSDILQILKRAARILGFTINDASAKLISNRARQTPRIAIRLLKRVRDFADIKNDGEITPDIANSALALLDIDELGLDEIDRRLLTIIIEKYNGGPVGLSTLAASLAEDIGTIEEIYEPFLMQLGLLARTPKGRIVTPQAYTHLGKKTPRLNQDYLL